MIEEREPVNEKQQTGDLSRREWLTKIGMLLNGIVVTLLAMPIIGYLVSPLLGADRGQYKRWITLGDLTHFPKGKHAWRLFRIPFLRLPMVLPTTFPAGYDASRANNFRCSQ